LPETARTDIAVVGAGPAGLAAALALAHVGADVALVGPAPKPESPEGLDARTAALLTSSIDMLRALGAFESLRPHAAPLKAIRIIDASESLIRAPDVEFEASELGLEAFGYNIANSALVQTLYARAAASLALWPSAVERIAFEADHALLSLKDGTRLAARLVVGADGRRSVCREAAGIGVSERRTGQATIASSFAHHELHRGVSFELHRTHGSVTTVPLTEPRASSLVWVGETSEIDALMALNAGKFAEALQARLDGLLGRIGESGARTQFAVTPLTADRLAARRTALVGEAAHVLPPIGAQGLNLGLRDAATLADCVHAALETGGDPGGESVLVAYEGARRLDVLTRSFGIDLLSRSLLTGFLPLHAARGLISHSLNALPPLRHLVMRIGMVPPTELPSLMRP
jgi:2-octaprenyl-6-methoxyphenol hydroxylase